MELKFKNNNDKVIMKNTYIFVLRDKEGKEIDKKVCHNVCMPKRYFVNNVTHLSLALGTMLPRDYLKFQENGVWKKDYARRNKEDGVVPPTESETPSVNERRQVSEKIENPETGKTETVTRDDGPVWTFNPKVKETDTGLFGTMVYNVRFDWECTSISSGTVQFSGKKTIDYHNPNSSLNRIKDWQDNFGLTNEQYIYTFDAQGRVSSMQPTVTHRIKGIELVDCCLVSNGLCLSHFNLVGGLWKRPFEKLEVFVAVTFENINCSFGTPFLPQGNAMYGHGSNAYSWSGLCYLRPTNFRFSGMPLKNCEKGCIPIMGSVSMSLNSYVFTDKPEDWDDEKDGIWYGTPIYHYFGAGSPYKKTTKKIEVIKDGGRKVEEEIEVDKLNAKGQRIFNYSSLKPAKIGTLGNCGPVRTLVLDGCAAAPISHYISPPSETIYGFQIGVGDGVTTRFAHAITTEIGKVQNAYTDRVGMGATVKNISHYSMEDNIFRRELWKMYDGIKTIEIAPNHYDEKYYDPKKRGVSFGLNPFTLDYYMGRNGLLGTNEWLIYQNTNGLNIKSYWIGMNEGTSIRSDVSIITADSESELYSQLGALGLPTLMAHASQHSDTTLDEPIQLKRYTALKGGNGWTTLGCYVGGFRYGFYDVSGIRICSSDKVPGFVEFDEPPRAGSKIYIDVKFNIPFFMNDMISLEGMAYSTFGDDEFNGKKKK